MVTAENKDVVWGHGGGGGGGVSRQPVQGACIVVACINASQPTAVR